MNVPEIPGDSQTLVFLLLEFTLGLSTIFKLFIPKPSQFVPRLEHTSFSFFKEKSTLPQSKPILQSVVFCGQSLKREHPKKVLREVTRVSTTVNSDFSEVIGRRNNVVVDALPNQGSRLGRPSERHNWYTGQRVSPFFSYHDSYVAKDFTISSRGGCSVESLIQIPQP